MQSLKVRGLVPIIVLAASVAATLSAWGAPPENAMNAASNGPAAPNWELKDLDGKTVHSSDFKAKVVILDFWATWCGPCRAEIPGFVALQNKYGPQGLVVVGASVDEGGASVVKQFTHEVGVNYPVMLADEKVQQAFGGIDAIPTTFIIDRAGRVVKMHFGFTSEHEFELEIKPLLNP